MTQTDPFRLPSVAAARNRPCRMDRMLAVSKCVRLAALDEHLQPVVKRDAQNVGPKVATGFLMRHEDGLYLYTCWHVVTGFDSFRTPALPPVGPQRVRHLKVALQDANPAGGKMEGIGGDREVTLALYQSLDPSAAPCWEQYRESRRVPEIESVGLRVPLHYDVVRLKIPDNSQFFSTMQVFSPTSLWRDYVAPGDMLFVAGFPYGFRGLQQHTQGVLLTRFAAQAAVGGQDDGPFLNSPCAHGMSGGPVLIEMGDHLFLAGVYTGSRNPDGPAKSPDQAAALGTFAPLASLLCGPRVELIRH